jgi:hypothetical protein
MFLLLGAAGAQASTDDLQCYKITNANLKGLKALVDLDASTIGIAPGCKLTKAKFYCVPAASTVRPGTAFDSKQPLTLVDRNDAPAESARICYQVACKKPKGAAPDQIATDQFGSHQFTKATISMVCSPATIANIAPPVAGFQIVTPEVTIPPGQEIAYCYYFRTPNNHTVAITRWSSLMSSAINDAVVFQTPTDRQPPGTMSAVSCVIGSSSAQNVPKWAYDTDTPVGELALPTDDGTGKPLTMELPANSAFYVRMHFVNAQDAEVTGRFTLNAEALADGVAYTTTGSFTSYDGAISIPPGAESQFENQMCTVPAGASFWRLSTHAHKQAVALRMLDGATLLFESTDWEHPGARIGPPFVTFAANKLTSSCIYNNFTNRTITAGESFQTDEECIGVGYFFPATASLLCFNGLGPF